MTAPVIFKTEVVSKRNWYNRVKEIMVAAGWQNVSSKPSTEYDIMYSPGEDGDLAMYIQMRDFESGERDSMTGGAMERRMTTRLIQSYTPGDPGVEGKVGRPAERWYTILVLYGEQPPDSTFLMHYHCNKNRIIIVNEFPPGQTAVYDNFGIGTIQFFGVSDRSMGENRLSAPVVAATQHGQSWGTVRVTGHPVFTKTESYTVNMITDMPILNPNTSGQIFMSEMAYGGPTDDGVRGYIDGLYAIKEGPNVPLQPGDILIDPDGGKYRVVKINPAHSGFQGAFNLVSSMYAFRQE